MRDGPNGPAQPVSMSFLNRLHLLWAIVVIAPVFAVLLALLGTSGSSSGETEATARQGLRTASALYEDARTAARREISAIAADGPLQTALVEGSTTEIQRRAEELVAANSRVVGITVKRTSERITVQAGSPAAVAMAGLTPTLPGHGPIGALTVSTTTAPELVGGIRRLTGLDARVTRGADSLASTLPPAAAEDGGSGEIEVDGREYRAASRAITEPAGAPIGLSVLATAEDGGAAGALRALLVALAVALLVIMAVAAAVAVVLLRRRLNELLGTARRIRGGDYRVRVPVRGNDRLAGLAFELNALSDQLLDRTEQVEQGRDELDDVTRRVGDAFASGLDPDALVDLVVRTVVERCSADAGRALPVDPEKMRSARVGGRDRALTEALATAERQAFRAGPEQGRELLEQVRAGDHRRPRARTIAYEATADGVHALGAPLRARLSVGSISEYVGVISIARRARAFSTAEHDLFAYLVAQAAVSIENAFMHERARQQAVTDELTGLANARRFHEALARELERTRRFSTEVALVIVDIDDFKQVNDEFGHQQGDAVLVEVARALREQCREIDHVARYGGEEMALVLPQTDLAGATELAERVRRAIARKPIGRLDGGGGLGVTASFGVAAVPESAADAQGLIAAADGALYRAKRSGKNRVARAEPRGPGRLDQGIGGEAERRASV
jgi:diguanylate cyclase (GGDEF)-like protein